MRCDRCVNANQCATCREIERQQMADESRAATDIRFKNARHVKPKTFESLSEISGSVERRLIGDRS